MCELNNNGELLNGEILKMKAEELQDQANLHLPTDEKLAMKFSKGWIERFKKR